MIADPQAFYIELWTCSYRVIGVSPKFLSILNSYLIFLCGKLPSFKEDRVEECGTNLVSLYDGTFEFAFGDVSTRFFWSCIVHDYVREGVSTA